jgi:galactokinase
MHRLGDLVAGGWQPSRALQPESVNRIRALAAEIPSSPEGPGRSAWVLFVPGRIEVLGKHTDYAGGRSLVAATAQGFWMVASPRTDSLIRMIDKGRGQIAEFAIEAQEVGGVKDWSLYPRTVASRVARDLGPDLIGADLAFESDLPASSGLSSSSSLVVGTFMALTRCNDLDRDPRWRRDLPTRERLAAYLGAVENGRSYGSFLGGEGVGTRGGDQDHTAILCSSPGEIRQYGFLPTLFERALKVPSRFVFAVAVSGVRANKTGKALRRYNRLSNLVTTLEQFWEAGKECPPATLGSIVREAPEGGDGFAEELEGWVADPEERYELQRRLDQFRRETMEIIPAAGDALADGDLVAFGRWVDLSMRLATESLNNQVEETIWLAAAARKLGAAAASAFGAGFGGAVWALVPGDGAESFLERWSADYVETFPGHRMRAHFFWTDAGGPASEL